VTVRYVPWKTPTTLVELYSREAVNVVISDLGNGRFQRSLPPTTLSKLLIAAWKEITVAQRMPEAFADDPLLPAQFSN
jgi:hypothetical protein